MLDQNQFAKQFKSDVTKLRNSEKVTKAILSAMSRYMLEQIHAVNCDIRPVNQLLDVLTPMNRQTAVAFFREFSGFKYSPQEKHFTEKNPKTYDVCQAKAMEFLDEEANNIWSWADKNVSVEPKPVDFSRLTKSVESMLKKAIKEGHQNPQKEILLAVLNGGVAFTTLVEVMQEAEAHAEQQPKAA